MRTAPVASASPKPEGRNQVQKILDLLQRHGDVISDALSGTVVYGEKSYSAGIDALMGINALMPSDEGEFQLNPRLRYYLVEELAHYGAFQSLTRIYEQIQAARTKWREIMKMKESGETRDMAVLEESLSLTITEIVHYTAQNLLLLGAQISTDFGNVKTLRAKLAQNKFYVEGVKNLLAELQQLEAFTTEIEREALGKGLYYIRQMVNVRIRSRLPDWMTRLNDVQSNISKRLFDSRLLDQELLYLSKAVLWLTRNPTRSGIDVEPDEKVNVAMVRPVPIRVRPQVDVLDSAHHAQRIFSNSVARLPKPLDPWAPKETSPVQFVLNESAGVVDIPMEPEDELLGDLIEALRMPDITSISVLEWNAAKRREFALDDEAWLLYAASQLGLLSFPIEFKLAERSPGKFNDVFEDLIVCPEASNA